MNTVGKTLVIVNLLFALITGAFLVVDFMTRTNWKQRYEELEREVAVAKAYNAESATSIGKTTAALRQAEKKVSEMENKVKEDEGKFRLALKEAEAQGEAAKFLAGKERVSSEVSLGELERLRQEVKGLTESVKKREITIIALEQEKAKYQNEAISAQSAMNAANERSASLLDRLTEIEKKLLTRDAGGPAAGTAVKGGNTPNPPPSFVKGIVEKVDRESGLVQISIGTDAGVGVDNTLEAYRTRPRPEYLGMIRIMEANHHKAVGRLMRSAGFGQQQPSLREGDEVATRLGPPY